MTNSVFVPASELTMHNIRKLHRPRLSWPTKPISRRISETVRDRTLVITD